MEIQRRSDKHGPIRDEIFKRQPEAIETYLDEWRDSEPPRDDGPIAALAPDAHHAGGAPTGMTSRDVSGRAEIARWLESSVFPATGERLVESARGLRAPDQVVRALESLPRQDAFQNVREVWQGLGGRSEDPTHRA
ncbi:DUF2795 domain-containing protein [Actinomadura sp. HBU206391]|uniref:DUF2795 domain-containing protein n=1 Tax=Actinomadura sp. HBU206391 TaxID=2731692 RepID=UPI00164FEE00|nr:DUF2795 domain-containing protein [Actinomadura sp. HBU206391]MBC6458735.1 DUF2795 domain-containing protein [Actinomadura sp. HBU206391]